MPLTFGKRLQGFALTQLDRATHLLSQPQGKPDMAIHETRRSLKRLRALLRLIQPDLPATLYHRDNLYLRNIGRQLSALRDAAVVEETFAALKKQFSAQLPQCVWHELKATLAAPARATDELMQQRMIAVAAKLRIARARIEKWPLEVDDLNVFVQGLRKSYRRGRRALGEAQQQPSATSFHEWRKQVNHLRYQLQLLQTLRLAKVKPTLRAFKSLAELLGLKNDLALLTRQLNRRQGNPTATSLAALQTLIQTRDEAYAEAAIDIGAQLYRPKAKDFLRAIWKRKLRRN